MNDAELINTKNSVYLCLAVSALNSNFHREKIDFLQTTSDHLSSKHIERDIMSLKLEETLQSG